MIWLVLGLKLLMARFCIDPTAIIGDANTKAPLPLYLARTALTSDAVGCAVLSGRRLMPLLASLQVGTTKELATYAPGQKKGLVPENVMDAAR